MQARWVQPMRRTLSPSTASCLALRSVFATVAFRLPTAVSLTDTHGAMGQAGRNVIATRISVRVCDRTSCYHPDIVVVDAADVVGRVVMLRCVYGSVHCSSRGNSTVHIGH